MTNTITWDTRPLPSAVREWADDVSGYLTDLYTITWEKETAARKDADWEFYQSEKSHVLDQDDINWVIEGSERTVVYIGRAWDGKTLFDDRAGVVVKFQSSVEATENPSTVANRQAIKTFTEICERGDEDLVSPFYGAAENGSWIAQQYAIPINPPRTEDGSPYDWIRDDPDEQLREKFKHRCQQRGLSVNISRGNIGVNQAGETVLTDIGGHTEYSPDLA